MTEGPRVNFVMREYLFEFNVYGYSYVDFLIGPCYRTLPSNKNNQRKLTEHKLKVVCFTTSTTDSSVV